MGIISYIYKKRFVCRYDKVIGIPYYSFNDFKGLKQEAYSFNNSLNAEIHYYFYYYDKYKEDKIVLFLPGIGPGHTAYLKEINELAKHGYKVLTLDYMGCDKSKGKGLRSLNEPTRDVNDLLNHLKLDTPLVLVGHSLGGFTSMNLLELREEINKAVILSGFLNIKSLIEGQVRSKFVNSRILAYERKVESEYFKLDNLNYLKNTVKKVLFIQSDNDNVVPYLTALKLVEELDNPSIKTLRLTGRFHNPNYSDSAIQYFNEVFGEYNKLIKEKKIKTDEDRINFFKDVSLDRLVEQDDKIISMICDFIN